MRERDLEDGRKELVLIKEDGGHEKTKPFGVSDIGTINEISTQAKNDLMRRNFKTPKADQYSQWMEKSAKELENNNRRNNKSRWEETDEDSLVSETKHANTDIEDIRARYTEPPFLPSEKRRIYFGPETPVLAPLTTQGNLPFRRLCVAQGAQVTYSEMAMSLPLIQGQKSEWALMRAHESEATPIAYQPSDPVVKNYNNAKDFSFGAQIAANKPWQALKATEILTQLCPYLRVIDLNCGCPIDLVYRTGAGSALLDSQGKLEKIVRGMNAVSGEIPITVKIRMGTKDNKPSALKLVDRLVYGGREALELGGGPSGMYISGEFLLCWTLLQVSRRGSPPKRSLIPFKLCYCSKICLEEEMLMPESLQVLQRLHCMVEAGSRDTRRTLTGSTYRNALLSSKTSIRKEMISPTLSGRRMRGHSREARSTFSAMGIASLTLTIMRTSKKRKSTQS